MNFKSYLNIDTEFLNDYHITDYSLLVSIHKYSEIEMFQVKNEYRVFKSFENKFLFCFSLIDFFTVRLHIYNIQIYDLTKKGEYWGKQLGARFLLQDSPDTSVQSPDFYYKRFMREINKKVELHDLSRLNSSLNLCK